MRTASLLLLAVIGCVTEIENEQEFADPRIVLPGGEFAVQPRNFDVPTDDYIITETYVYVENVDQVVITHTLSDGTEATLFFSATQIPSH